MERSPRILDIAWSRMDVEGLGAETGTSHVPGIQPADVDEIIARGATVVVLSLGIDRALQVAPETLTYLDERHIEVHVLETREAVKVYNDLADRAAVGGLFHSTC